MGKFLKAIISDGRVNLTKVLVNSIVRPSVVLVFFTILTRIQN